MSAAIKEERPVVECDLNGTPISQSTMDWLCRGIQKEMGRNPFSMVDIVIKRVPANYVMPRLIVDYNDIYEALTELLKQRDQRIERESNVNSSK